METADLTVAKVAEIVGCHINTVKNYEQQGLIRAMRDHNNHRRYRLGEALKLKRIFSIRKPNERQ